MYVLLINNTYWHISDRDDASPDKKIILPVDTPFILVRFGDQCQEVHGINVLDLYIHWDENDGGFYSSYDWGMHPFDEGENGGDHMLHFCYYGNRTILVNGQEVPIGRKRQLTLVA